ILPAFCLIVKRVRLFRVALLFRLLVRPRASHASTSGGTVLLRDPFHVLVERSGAVSLARRSPHSKTRPRTRRVLQNGLTTQAQRPGPREAWIATTARWPGSLQRMVRPRHFIATKTQPAQIRAPMSTRTTLPCQPKASGK